MYEKQTKVMYIRTIPKIQLIPIFHYTRLLYFPTIKTNTYLYNFEKKRCIISDNTCLNVLETDNFSRNA